MKTFTQRCSQLNWRTFIAGGFKTFLVLFLLSFIITDTNAQVVLDGKPGDWCSVIGGVKPNLHVRDQLNGNNDDTEFNQGTSDNLDIPKWHWGVGNISGKTDLGNVGLVVDGCTIYFFADRFAAEGDADLGLWLFKNAEVSLNPDGTFNGTHLEGDILITSKFTNGGGEQTTKVYIWTNGDLELLFDTDEDPSKENISAGFVNEGIENVTCGWDYTGKFPDVTKYQPGTFYEGYLNLCLLDEEFPGLASTINECFANFIFKTSQSPSPTSANGDLVFGNINSLPEEPEVTGSTFCAGTGTGTVSVANSSASVRYYLEKQNGGTWDPVSNSLGNGGILTFTDLSTGTYRVRAVNINTISLCETISDNVEVTAITVNGGTGSANQTVCSGGDPAALSVTGASTGTYQWQSNTTGCEGTWVDINMATSATYDPPSGFTTTTYYRRKTTVNTGGVLCEAYSTCITVTVNNVEGGTGSADQTHCGPADPDELSVSGSSSTDATPTYKWQSNTTGCGGAWVDINMATSATYNPPAGLTTTTYYRRITISTVNGVECSDPSSCITVTVNNVDGGTGSADQAHCAPANPTVLSVTGASASQAMPTYQWQSNTTGCGSEFADIPGATGATYDPPAGLTVTTYYRRITTSTINGVICSDPSTCITVSVTTVTGGTGSANQTLCGPADPSVLSITGGSAGSYQWQSSTTSCESGFGNIPGATGATYDPPAGLTTTTYYQRITTIQNGVSCPAISSCITVTVNNVDGGTGSTDQTLCSPANPGVLSVTGSSSTDVTPTYKWQSNTTGCGNAFADIPGATGATYDPPAGLTTTTYYQRLTISTVNGVECSDPSTCITVTVNTIDAGTIAGGEELCSPANPAAFTSVTPASGTATPTYKWESKPGTCQEGGTWVAIDGATSATYDVPAGLTATTSYRRVATSTVNGVPCSANSNCITVTVKPTPAPPVLSVVNNCESSTISAKDAGGALIPEGELTWSNGMEGNPIVVTTTTSVTAYRTVDGCPSANSNSVTPAPKPIPGAPSGIPANGCIGQQLTLGASGCTGTYKWYATNISTEVLGMGSTFMTPVLNGNATYYVSCTVDGCEGPRTAVMATVADCGSFCTYTQGYFGNAGGKSCDGETGGLSTTQLIEQSIANWGGTILIGSGTRSVKIETGDAEWVIKYLPGGGQSYALSSPAIEISSGSFATLYTKTAGGKTKINNTLLAQTITLGLNLGINDDLATFSFASHSAVNKYLVTQELESCGGNVGVPDSYTCDELNPAE